MRDERPPSFRIAYTPHHLYLAVEVNAAHLEPRDRAYQNGDGVVVVVGRAHSDGGPTEEFSVLGFSPGTPAARWQQRFVWYRNVNLEFRPLEDTEVATASRGDRSFFEIAIPWREVYPLHPWLASDGIGFNVCVTRAMPNDAYARYCLVDDPHVNAEQHPRRYLPLSFAEPSAPRAPATVAILDRNTMRQGSDAHLELATLAPSPRVTALTVRVLSGEGTRVSSRQTELQAGAGVQRQEVELPTSSLAPGGYTVTWEATDGTSKGRIGLTIVAPADVTALRRRLASVASRVRRGSFTTLQFRLEDIERQERALRPHDVALSLRLAIDQLLADLAAAEAGSDALAGRTGVVRRAYRSRVDGTLQPYSVRIPDDYDPRRTYPLLVYLHGSGEDDRNQLSKDWLPRAAVILAPSGRGTSNWYTSDHAQDDIREAIADVLENYRVDPQHVVLSGFSMGGYGVYRTFKESPKRFAGLAVFSGIPRVPNSPAGAPDFLETEDLAVFRGTPLFIFHGGKDRNCPIEQTRMLVSRFEKAGVDVEFHYEEGKGHETPGPATLKAFQDWIAKLVRSRPTPSGR